MNCFFHVQLGAIADGFLKDSRVTIGGSPSTGNVFVNVDLGSVLTIAQNSLEEFSFNKSAGYPASMVIAPWIQGVFEPSGPFLYKVHNNNLTPEGPFANGVVLADDPTDQQLYAMVYNNTIKANDIGSDAIATYFMKNTTILNNQISGNGPDAIGVWDGTSVAVLKNNVTNFTVNPAAGLAQIVLDGSLQGLPDTSQSTVVCKTPEDTVMNLGANNKVIGCQQLASSSAQPSKMTPLPKVLKKNPLIP